MYRKKQEKKNETMLSEWEVEREKQKKRELLLSNGPQGKEKQKEEGGKEKLKGKGKYFLKESFGLKTQDKEERKEEKEEENNSPPLPLSTELPREWVEIKEYSTPNKVSEGSGGVGGWVGGWEGTNRFSSLAGNKNGRKIVSNVC